MTANTVLRPTMMAISHATSKRTTRIPTRTREATTLKSTSCRTTTELSRLLGLPYSRSIKKSKVPALLRHCFSSLLSFHYVLPHFSCLSRRALSYTLYISCRTLSHHTFTPLAAPPRNVHFQNPECLSCPACHVDVLSVAFFLAMRRTSFAPRSRENGKGRKLLVDFAEKSKVTPRSGTW